MTSETKVEVWNWKTGEVKLLRPGMIFPFEAGEYVHIMPPRVSKPSCLYCGGHVIDKAQRCAGCGAAR